MQVVACRKSLRRLTTQTNSLPYLCEVLQCFDFTVGVQKVIPVLIVDLEIGDVHLNTAGEVQDGELVVAGFRNILTSPGTAPNESTVRGRLPPGVWGSRSFAHLRV